MVDSVNILKSLMTLVSCVAEIVKQQMIEIKLECSGKPENSYPVYKFWDYKSNPTIKDDNEL
jgi:hypothetical protein